MEKPFVLTLREAKEDIANKINEYSQIIPADILADYLAMVSGQLRQVADRQIAELRIKYQSEVDKTE